MSWFSASFLGSCIKWILIYAFFFFESRSGMRCSQFSYLYPEATKPAGGIFHYVGGSCERASCVSHASTSALPSADRLFTLSWVVGAFISAYRTVRNREFIPCVPVWVYAEPPKSCSIRGSSRRWRINGQGQRRLMCRCWSNKLRCAGYEIHQKEVGGGRGR